MPQDEDIDDLFFFDDDDEDDTFATGSKKAEAPPPPPPRREAAPPPKPQPRSAPTQKRDTVFRDDEIKEDVMKQGKTYKGEDLDNPDEDEFDDNGGNRRTARRRTRERKELDPEQEAKKKKLYIIVGGIAVVVVLALLASTYFADKVKEDTNKRGEELLSTEYEAVFEYLPSEIAELRANGYTGDEIEEYESMSVLPETLIEEAQAARREENEAELLPLFDSASDEYRELQDKTWFGQADLEVDSDVDYYEYFQQTLNLDYEKVPATGMQLFLKVYIDGSKAFFMTVTPERWSELPDSGNIVVSINYTRMANGCDVITDITEIQN